MGQEHPQSRDCWSKIQVFMTGVGVASAVAIPILLFFLNQQQQEGTEKALELQRLAELEQRNLDRVAFLTKSISSENEKERQIAVGVVEYLKDEGLLPDELRAALLESTLRDEEVVGGEELPTATPDAGTLAVEDAGPLVSPGTTPPVEPNDNSSERLARMFPRVHFFVPDPRQKIAGPGRPRPAERTGYPLSVSRCIDDVIVP